MKYGKHLYNMDVKATLKKDLLVAPMIAHLHLNNNDEYWFLKIVIRTNKHASLSILFSQPKLDTESSSTFSLHCKHIKVSTLFSFMSNKHSLRCIFHKYSKSIAYIAYCTALMTHVHQFITVYLNF